MTHLNVTIPAPPPPPKPPEPKNSVLVARRWHQPNVEVGVSTDGIRVHLPLEDFVQALLHEMAAEGVTLLRVTDLATAIADRIGNPAPIVTRGQLARRIEAAVAEPLPGGAVTHADVMAAVARVVAGIKQETARLG